MSKSVNQMELVAAILHELERQGLTDISSRCANCVIDAATRIVTVANAEPKYATPDMGLEAWLASDDCGLSSLYMVFAITGEDRRGGRQDVVDYPRDPSDFGRCYRLLEAVPAFRSSLGAVADKGGPVWKRLVDDWANLEALYLEELPNGTAPKLYARMKDLIRGA